MSSPAPTWRSSFESESSSPRRGNKPLRVYCGFDPTASDLHLGHTVPMRKLAQFQELGHEVVFLIGSFTALIGDPSDKSAARRQQTDDEVREHARTYTDQAWKVLGSRANACAIQRRLAIAAYLQGRHWTRLELHSPAVPGSRELRSALRQGRPDLAPRDVLRPDAGLRRGGNPNGHSDRRHGSAVQSAGRPKADGSVSG